MKERLKALLDRRKKWQIYVVGVETGIEVPLSFMRYRTAHQGNVALARLLKGVSSGDTATYELRKVK